jgi:DNA-binding GntR family transcriptional regulator
MEHDSPYRAPDGLRPSSARPLRVTRPEELTVSRTSPLDVLGALQARLRRIRHVGNESPEKWAAAVADHEEMIAALEARDGARLAHSLAAHMRSTWDRVRDSM